MTRVPNPHDTFFEFTFRDPEHAAPLLRRVVPAEIAAACDWSTLRRLPGTHVDEEQRRVHSDLLFEVRVSGRPVLVYVLVEHKSRSDRWTALQVLGYVVSIWEEALEHEPMVRALPPVVPIVVHHGRRRWSGPVEIAALLDWTGFPQPVAAALAGLQPRYGFLLDDFATRSEADLRGMALSLFGMLTIACLQFLRGRSPEDMLSAFARWIDVAKPALTAPSGRAALAAVYNYLLSVTSTPASRLAEVVAQRIGPDAEEIMKSTATKLREEGREEGRAEIVLSLLKDRFGDVGDGIVARVRRARGSQLDLWARRILSAATLDDVFAGSDHA